MSRWLRHLSAFLSLLAAGSLEAQIVLVNTSTYTGQTLADSIQINGSTYAYFTGGTTFTGPNATFGSSAGLYWQQIGTLTGKTFTLGNNAYVYVQGTGNSLTLNSSTLTTGNGAYFYLSGANTSLTLDSGTSMTGGISLYSDGSAGTTITNQGALTHNVGSGSLYAANFTNSGSITATGATYLYLGYPSAGYNTTNTGTVTSSGSGTYVYLRGNFDNNGTVTAQNSGNLIWDGNNTTANLGNVTLSGGGRALLNGTIDNTSATLTAPTGGSYELYGGTISGGTIASGALSFTSSGGYLSGATLNGDLSVGNNAYVRLTNNANYTGTNVTLGSSAGLYWQQAGTLTGNTFSLGNNGYVYVQGTGNNLTLNSSTVTTGNGSYFYLSGANTSLTVGSGTTITGGISLYSDGSTGTAITNQGTLTHNIGSGSIYAANFTNAGTITASGGSYLYLGYPSAGYNTTNTGTVTSSGSGTYVYLRGNFDNNGTLSAQNSGILLFDGSNTTANLGNVTLSGGGRALLNGTIDNTSATLTAPTGGSYELYGGTISGGTIASGALSFTSSGGYLSGATLNGDLSVGNNAYVRLTNNANYTGTNVTLGSSAGLYWQQAGTLTGNTFSLGNNGYVYVQGTGNNLTLNSSTVTTGNGSYFYLSGANTSLTVGSGTTLTGGISLYSDGSAGTAITNQGTLTHNIGSGSLYAANFTNAGAISATSGSYLYFGYPSAGYNSTNTGTVTADGSGTYVYLRGNFDNNGTVTAQNSGILLFDGSNTTANLGNVNLATGGRALLNGTIDNTSATLTAPTGGSYELYGGTISGGAIASGALSFTTSGGYLSGATLTGDLNLAGSSQYVRFTNNATFTGTNATFANSAGLYWQQVGTLSGKALTMGSGAYLYVAGANNAITLDSATTVTGSVSLYADGSTGTAITNQGTLTHNSGSGSIYAANFTNAGTITASNASYLYLGYPSAGYNTTNTGTVTSDGSGTYVYLRGNLDNNGTVTAQNNGILLWDGSNTTANLGNVTLSGGGRALLNGTIDNTSATLTAPTGGSFELYGGTISGGTIASGALGFTGSGGYLSGTTLTGDLNLAGTSQYVRFTNNATFTGANATFANNAGLYWQQVGSLSGKALTLGSGAYVYVTGVNNALTLDSATTVTGNVSIYTDGNVGTTITNQGAISHTSGSGNIYAANFTNAGTINATGGTLYLNYPSVSYNATNTGSISADGASTTVYIRGSFDNNGTLTAQNSGTLLFDGTTTTANLGSVTLGTGGRARLNGTLDNTAATLNAPTGGAYELYGGTISGGTIASGALTFSSSGGYLSGTTLTGDLTLGAGSSYVRLQNNASFTGALLSMAANSGLYWQQIGTLSGKTITQGTGSYLYVQGTNNSLTLDATTSVTGAVSVYTDSSAGTAITNQGTLTHSTNTTGYLYAQNLTNQGTLAVNTGTLYLGYFGDDTTTNAAGGTITLGGGNVYVYSPMTNLGLINIVSGTLLTNANLTNTSGTIGGAGSINGGLTLTGGTLAPGNSIGTLTFASGNFNVTGATVFAVELDATTADKIVFQNPGTVNIGSGLLQLSLNLLSAPTANMTYTLMDITSGGSGISGYLAGLPNNGDGFTAYFGGNPYDFHVSYLTNKLSIQAVPEPGTYALMGAGLAAVALLRRRRKVS